LDNLGVVGHLMTLKAEGFTCQSSESSFNSTFRGVSSMGRTYSLHS